MHETPPPADEPTPAESAVATVAPRPVDPSAATAPTMDAAAAEAEAGPSDAVVDSVVEPVTDSPPNATPAAEPESAADAATVSTTDTPPAPPVARAPAPPPVPDLSAAACVKLLADHFPALFGKGVFLPIKLRIQADIQARVPGVFNKKSLSIFLHRHTTSTGYIKALLKADTRFDLDGQPAGEITAEHRAAAETELARRREIVDGRRAQEREALRAKQQDERTTARKEQRARETAQHNAEDEARRERAALLRSFESSTLTRANFCALKGIVEDTLDAKLDQAWHEREARGREAPPSRPPPQQPQRDDRNRPRGARPGGRSGGGKPDVKPSR